MVLYNYKYNSILNSTIARLLNGIVLFPLLIGWSCTTFHLNITTIDGNTILLMLLYTIVSTSFGVWTILSKNRWCVIDKKESERKQSFIVYYCCISFCLATLIAITSALAIRCYMNGGQVMWYYIATIAYLGFNKLNLCSLYNFNNFFEELFPLYDCDDLAMIKHVLARDYEIYLDDLIWDARRFRELQKNKRED